MNKKRPGIFIVIGVLVLTSLACSLSSVVSGVTGAGSAGTVSDLWPDVPKMSGMDVSKDAIPLEVKVMVQTFLAGASGNQGSVNFVAYTTDHSLADVIAYYSDDRMKSAGWDSTDLSGCIADTTSATPSVQGGICLFGKTNPDNSGTLLAIVPSTNTTTNKTDIFFARIDIKDINTPTP